MCNTINQWGVFVTKTIDYMQAESFLLFVTEILAFYEIQYGRRPPC